MYANTQALVTMRRQGQALFDFVVLTCYAVPALKIIIKNVESGSSGARLPEPDHFKGQRTAKALRDHATSYKEKLSHYIILSTFSFFEAYVKNAITEMLDFHGGPGAFVQLARARSEASMDTSSSKIKKCRAKLQDSLKRDQADKYRRNTAVLCQTKFRFPSDLLSAFGIHQLAKALDPLWAKNIPMILRDALQIPLTEAQVQRFRKVQKLRNDLAHGRTHRLGFKGAIENSQFLRELAVSIDKHLVQHYFVIEKFA